MTMTNKDASATYTTIDCPDGFGLLSFADANSDDPDVDVWIAELTALDVGESYDIPVCFGEMRCV